MVVMTNTGRSVFLWRPVNSTLPLYWPILTRNPRPHRVSLSYSVAARVHTGVAKMGESAPSGDCGIVCRTNSSAVIHAVRRTNSKSHELLEKVERRATRLIAR